MFRPFRSRVATRVALLVFLTSVGSWLLWARTATLSHKISSGRTQQPAGYPQLVSVQLLPDGEPTMCAWSPASSQTRLVALLEQQRVSARASTAPDVARRSVALERPPERVIHDPYPTYSAVALDPVNREIVLQDENLFQIMVYDAKTNTPATAKMSEPKRVIGGPRTKVEFNCALYVDPNSGDIYSVSNDTLDRVTIFSREARGDVPPTREIRTPHRAYGIAVDEAKQELFITVQDPPLVVVYSKTAKGNAKPLRVLRGNRTRLRDTHGIALNVKRGLMFVSNYGAAAEYKDGGGDGLPRRRGDMIPGTGKYTPPSITVYPIDARGDTLPLRVIEGPKTTLNWPAHIYLDAQHGELYVANDGNSSILVFRETDEGDVAPARVLKGPKTLLANPTGVLVDTANNELIVANMGNHMATVYPRTAEGDVAPLRVIRGAPLGAPSLQIGNPGAVAYDSKREEILVPN